MLQIIKKAVGFLKKAFLVVAVYFVVISLFLYFIAKDKPIQQMADPIEKNRVQLYKILNDPKLKNTKEGKISLAIYRSIICGMIGEACTDNPADGDKNFNHSLFGYMTNLIVLPYANPPASGIYWAYSGLQNAGFVPKTYAAEGIGFAAIKPFMDIWKAFRNVAYMVLVLVLIAIGFMIMFRMKINPQTVISLENALPKIVIALILITFSFAIAGFLIDLMYVAIILIISIIGPAGKLSLAQVADKQRAFLQAGPGTLYSQLGGVGYWSRIFWRLPNALLGLIPVINYAVRIIGGLAGAYFLYDWLAMKSPFGDTFKAFTQFDADAKPLGFGFSWKGLSNLLHSPIQWSILLLSIVLGALIIVPAALGLLFFLTVIFMFFRIIFLLMSAYIKILLLIIISPLYLLLEGIPGRSAFSSWLKNLLSALIIFPTIVGIFMLVTLITSTIDTGLTIQFPFMVGIDPQNYSFIIAMAILYLTPDLVGVVKQLFVPKPGPLDMAGLGVFFGGAKTGFEAGIGQVSKWAGLGYYVPGIGKAIEGLSAGKIKMPSGKAPPSAA